MATEFTLHEVKFVSFTGKFPNLCDGVLTVEIDGVEHRFDEVKSGGKCDFGSGSLERGAWEIDGDYYPNYPAALLKAVTKEMNKHAEHGCCGGCF